VLGACSNQTGVYKLSKQEAFARLRNADTMAFRRAWQCGILIHFEPTEEGDDALTWRVVSDGETMLSFTVRLVDEGSNRTRAVIELPPDPRGGEYYDGTHDFPRPALNQPIRPGIQQLVDAALNQTEFKVNQMSFDRTCEVQRGGLEGGSPPFKVYHRRQDGIPY
jgi:hypothetical protein